MAATQLTTIIKIHSVIAQEKLRYNLFFFPTFLLASLKLQNQDFENHIHVVAWLSWGSYNF